MSTSSVVDLAAFIPQLREMVCKEAFDSPLAEAKAVTVDQSPMAALADASEITGFPRDNFEVHEISKEEFKRLRVRSLADKGVLYHSTRTRISHPYTLAALRVLP